MYAQLCHNALFGTITLHYKSPSRLTVSSYDVIHSYIITFYWLQGYRVLTAVKNRYSTRQTVTAHSSKTIGWHVLSPKVAPSHGDLDPI